ncbi:MAG TPA: BACON domain-containing carbohydrate-binding protein, partial [Vicinamibacterales bacterium]|nr:BACON domain-containing carbohydrate-binding protein [Vicinamibacterales bacterium]
SNAAWITIASGANGSGNGTVGYNVAANTTTSTRTGTLTIAGKTFTVSQAAATPPGAPKGVRIIR